MFFGQATVTAFSSNFLPVLKLPPKEKNEISP
jgi:hypothetical protein